MTGRERLVELLRKDNCCIDYDCNKCLSNIHCYPKTVADRILADGWIRPPCKVGDVVYFVARNSGKPIGNIDEVEIVMIGKTEKGFCAKGKLGENTFDIYPKFEIDNHTFYASREEAEKALKGGEQG